MDDVSDLIAELEGLKARHVVSEATAQIYINRITGASWLTEVGSDQLRAG